MSPKPPRARVSNGAMKRVFLAGRGPLWAAAPAITALVALVSACPEPRQGDAQIPISPGWEKRQHGGADEPNAKRKVTTAPPAPAHAAPMKPGEELGGPNATGKPGDWVLANDEVVFVIEGLGGGSGFAESGGNLIDAADAKLRKDELGQLFTYFGTFPRQAVYTAIEGKTELDGSAWIRARGKELYDPSIECETVYRLAPGDRAVLIATTLTNGGAAPVKLGLGDAIQWGGAEKLAPGKPVGFKGPSSGPFLGGIGRFTSYALTSTEGEMAAISGSVWSDTEQKKDVTIEPGKSASYERVFVVGERGDAASVIAELTKASGGAVGALEVALVDGAGKTVTPAPGAKVILSTPAGEDVMSVVAAEATTASATSAGATGATSATSATTTFGGEVPPGKWLVSYAPSAGRRGDGKKVAVVVKKGATAKAVLRVSDAAVLAAGCDVPCRITIEGLDGTPTPELGPHHVASAARNQLFAAERFAETPIAPGKYRLTATRGPEYAAEVRDFVARPLAEELGGHRVSFTLHRVVDTSGYVATDFHQHSMRSADAPVSVLDRVRSNVVEGVEIAVATEHNFVADFGPAVRELGLGKQVVAIPGDEITTDADKNAWGHANVFPLVPAPDKPRAGAFTFLGRTPKDVFDEVRRLPDRPIVQINHPRSGQNGYFDRTGFDPKTGVGTLGGYDASFDSVEVWNGRNVEARTKVLEDFLALLRTGHPVTPIGDTDTHGIVGQEAGYPRTYVRVAKDDALETWDAARTSDLVEGVRTKRDVVLTNGPFVRASANGAPIGGVAKGRVIKVQVHVQSAPFAAPELATIRLARDAKVVGPSSVRLNDKGEASFEVRATKDDAFVVIVSGGKPMRPMLSGDDAEIVPWAMTGAIWIDADGDGKSLGR
jgi:hypothetical protein